MIPREKGAQVLWHISQRFSSGETPFSAWWGPKIPKQSCESSGAPGWEGAGSSHGPRSVRCNPASVGGSDPRPPSRAPRESVGNRLLAAPRSKQGGLLGW